MQNCSRHDARSGASSSTIQLSGLPMSYEFQYNLVFLFQLITTVFLAGILTRDPLPRFRSNNSRPGPPSRSIEPGCGKRIF